MKLETGEKVRGFTVQAVERIPEIDGTAYTMIHEESGARLLYLANGDIEKTFSIGFKTPPTDDTGVFHIIEHSVLCGSERFPVKEPFVNLLKGSMQTFLNAITFPDKTIYPVSSTNEQDLLNLMDVYLDSVLHPIFYRKPAIFEQEGWHYELKSTDRCEVGRGGADRLVYNGIVYNEMKGALSDPENKLEDALMSALFPDTAYQFESGGTPSDITSLTYETLIDVHRRHYRLDNSYITLYGNLNIDRILCFLEEEYLGPEVLRSSQSACGVPNPLALQSPLRSFGNRIEVVTEPRNACMALGYVAGSARDRTRLLAIDILLDAVMGSNEAPLKRALLEAGLADEVSASLFDGILQPFVIVKLRGMKKGAELCFRDELEGAVRMLVDKGLDHDLLKASFLQKKFSLHENNYGACSGLGLVRRSLDGWLYDDAEATTFLRFEDSLREMEGRLDEGYFERLLRELFLDNSHAAGVEVVPIAREAERKDRATERLEALSTRLSEKELAVIERNVRGLRDMQMAPDTAEALMTLPHLALEDLGCPPEEPVCHMSIIGSLRCLRHEVKTRGIVYTNRCYDLKSVDFEEVPYLSLLSMSLGNLDTDAHTASELDVLIGGRLGSLSFSIDLYEEAMEFGAFTPVFSVSTSSLTERVADAAELSREVMLTSRFHDREKMRKLLAQKLIRMERGFANNGRGAATRRAASYYLPSAVMQESLSGIDQYRFLKDLVEHFDERADEIADRLRALTRRLFTDDGCIMSFAGSDDDLDRFLEAGGSLGSAYLPSSTHLVVPIPRRRNEAFITPNDVTYAALSYDYRLLGQPYSGSWSVMQKALSYEYLWNEIRVKGGAYGAGFNVSRTGDMGLYSYRDPHLDRTIACFRQAGSWLAGFEPSTVEMDGYIISAVADCDAPVKPRGWIRRQIRDFFEGYTPEMKAQIRNEILGTTAEDMRHAAMIIDEVIRRNVMCAFGNRDAILRSAAGFDVVDLFGK